MRATAGGEPAAIELGYQRWQEPLTWNALGMLHRYRDSTWHYDAFGEARLTVTGPAGGSTSIVSVGDDFEYDVGASRANKSFSIGGVRIATLATHYTAPNADDTADPAASSRITRNGSPRPAALALLATCLLGLARVTLRRRTPRWLEGASVGVLSAALVGLPHAALAATLSSGPGRYGRHAEPILAYLSDHLGTIRAVVSRDGIVVETRDYAPFGESIAHAGAFSVQDRFTGQPQDDRAGGLYNYGARFYNAKWGRFISPDEVTQAFDSQGLNPYSYVLNQPTSATDPTGRLIWNGVSFGAWSTATLQSGVLNANPTTVPEQTHGMGFAAGFPSYSRPIPAFLDILGESVVKPTAEFLKALSKVMITDLQGLLVPIFPQLVVNPFESVGDFIHGLVNGSPIAMRDAVWRLIKGTLIPRYGLQNGPYWGRDRTSNDKLDSVLEDAGFEHDGMCAPSCDSAADRAWIKIAWSNPWRLGPYGQAYRLLGTGAFRARILLRTATGWP